MVQHTTTQAQPPLTAWYMAFQPERRLVRGVAYRRLKRALDLLLCAMVAPLALPLMIAIGLLIALEYWRERNLNSFADADDVVGLTKAINGGVNGLDDRKAQLARVKGWLA